ncbi:hypothetical protein ACIQJX_07700 [Streptomyces griseoviridis]
MTKQLTTQNATITTAAVEVKTLTISGKQVTLAVFRQLREEPLLDADGNLAGVPWGVVNYHPDKCANSVSEHWHVVWQRGSELLRARVERAAPFDPRGEDEDGYPRITAAAFVSPNADRLLSVYVLAWLMGERETCPLPENPPHLRHSDGVHQSGARYESEYGFSVRAKASRTAVEAANARAKLRHTEKLLAEADAAFAKDRDSGANPWDDYREMELSAARHAHEGALAEDVRARDALAAQIREWVEQGCDVRKEHETAVEAEAARRRAYREVLSALAELPQLFIAV